MAGSDSGRNWPPLEDLGGEENLLLNFERVAKTRLGNGNTTPNPSPPKPNIPPQVNTVNTVNAPQLFDPNFKFKVKVPPVAPPVSIPIQPIAKAKTTRKSERLAGKPKKSFQPDDSKQDDLDQELDDEEEEEEEDDLDDEEEYEEGGELYCICRTSKSSGFMICCDICEQWFHGTCIKLSQKDAQYVDKYHCPNCEKTHGPSSYKSLPPPPPRQNKRQKSESGSPAPKANVTSNPVETVTGPRKRKESGFYKELDEGNLNIDGTKESKVATNFLKFLEEKKISNENVAKTLNGNEWNVEYVEKYGLNYPIKFDNVDGLDMKLPPPTFSLDSIKALVGPKTLINVIDVATQQEVLPQWNLEQFVDYYNSKSRSKIYNVISLEVSKTKLAERVSPPATVRAIDWIDNVWPKDQTTNYPQVQLYCLMSVKGSFTDFHLDFGGTSVYYHILRGQKLFLFVPPTEENLKKYSDWTSALDQHEVFFGDLVQDVYPVLVEQGQTLIVPTAWIHAVYTPQDSLVFGGNFLHSYNIKQQLAVYEIEETTKVPEKFRFPFYEQMMWYAAVKFLSQLKDIAANKRGPLSILEHEGVIDLVATLDNWLKSNKKNDSIPPTILNPRQLLSDLSDFLLKSPPEISVSSADPWLDVIQHNRQSGNIMTVSEIVDRIKNPSAYYDTNGSNSLPDPNAGLKITLQPQSSIPPHVAPPSADEVSLLANDDDFYEQLNNPEKKLKTEANPNLFGSITPQ